MKNKSKSILVIATIFIVFNVSAFIIPTQKTTGFWITYLFSVLSFVIEAIVWNKTIGNDKTLKSKFMTMPITYLGIVYLGLQIALFLIIKFIPSILTWVAIILNIILLVIFIVLIYITNYAEIYIENVDKKTSSKVYFIKNLEVEIELIKETVGDSEIKSALENVLEKVKYSDPISDENLESIDISIVKKVNEIKSNGETKENILLAIVALEKLLDERNKKCKLLK